MKPIRTNTPQGFEETDSDLEDTSDSDVRLDDSDHRCINSGIECEAVHIGRPSAW